MFKILHTWVFILILSVPCLHGHLDNFEYLQSIDDKIEVISNDLSARMYELEATVFGIRQDLKKSGNTIQQRLNRGLRNAKIELGAKLENEFSSVALTELVTDAVTDMLQGHTFHKISASAHATEIKVLKQVIRQLKRQIQTLLSSMERIEEDNAYLRTAMHKIMEDSGRPNKISQPDNRMEHGVTLSGGVWKTFGMPVGEPDMTSTLSPGQCALPVSPDLMAEGIVNGTRFGSMVDSRHEHNRLQSSFRIRSVFEVDLKTTAENGIILYLSDSYHRDYLALYMKNGYVVYAFNCGSGAAVMTSEQKYNDGKWHHIAFARVQFQGTLEVDGTRVSQGRSKGRCRSINVVAPYYVGGAPLDIKKKSSSNLQGVFGSFIGCLKNFKLNEKDFGSPSKQVSVKPCSDAMEAGSFFTADEGYVKLYDTFKVGLDLEIRLEIKPRLVNGLILAVHSKGNYLVMEMVEGEIILTVDNGMGAISTRYSSPTLHMLCDGNWHSITALKAKEVVLLTVDGTTAPRGQGKPGVSAADTNDPLYIGGAPDYDAKGITAKSSFVGCIRNLQLNGEMQYIGSGNAVGNVKMDSCPVS